jgi:Protein of unknown function (DUF3179)
MSPRLRLASILTVFVLLAALAPEEAYHLLSTVLTGKPAEREAAARKLAAARDLSLVPGMVDALFFTPQADREPLVEALRKLTGEDAGPRYYDWVELVGRRTDLKPAPGYLAWKGTLFARIDPKYRQILDPNAPVRLRPEEIVWGGVPLDGIPSLDDPPRVAAEKARSLMDQERVFAVSLGGEHRAYPLRYLSWHEMLNDTVGGQPLTLSYCTLCGTGIAYSSRLPDGTRHTFGTSGLLYRSNKLMFDRETSTLWSNLTGEAVLGKLADRPFRLEMLPMTLTTWGEWKSLHPDTTVVELDAAYGAKWGYRYLPGSADQRRAGVSFPVWAKSRLLPERAEIYGLRQGDRAKAWPVERVLRERVVNDRLADLDLVLVGNPDSGAVRAYHRDGRTFRAGSVSGELRDEADRVWRVTEEALVSEGEAPLPRVPGHVALWFAWFGFFPQTELAGPAIGSPP